MLTLLLILLLSGFPLCVVGWTGRVWRDWRGPWRVGVGVVAGTAAAGVGLAGAAVVAGADPFTQTAALALCMLLHGAALLLAGLLTLARRRWPGPPSARLGTPAA